MAGDNLSFYERQPNSDSIAVVRVPVELGIDEGGEADAPQYLFESGLEKMLTSLGCAIVSDESVRCTPRASSETFGTARYLDEIASISRATCGTVKKSRGRGDFVLALGGDHSMAIGTIAGAAASAGRRIGVVYIDAHPDCNTPETTITGKIHGMTAAASMGVGHSLLTEVGGSSQKIAPENFVYIGLKDIDAAEIDFIRQYRTPAVTMLDIARRGLAPAIMAIDALRRRVDSVWVSMDMDSIDAEYAPGVGLAMPGGLTRREVLSLAQYIGKSCNLLGADIVEISPQKDIHGKTAALALEIIARFLGTEYSWYQNEYIDVYRETNVSAQRSRV